MQAWPPILTMELLQARQKSSVNWTFHRYFWEDVNLGIWKNMNANGSLALFAYALAAARKHMSYKIHQSFGKVN